MPNNPRVVAMALAMAQKEQRDNGVSLATSLNDLTQDGQDHYLGLAKAAWDVLEILNFSSTKGGTSYEAAAAFMQDVLEGIDDNPKSIVIISDGDPSELD